MSDTQPKVGVHWVNPGLPSHAGLPNSMAGRGHTPVSEGQEVEVQPFSQVDGYVDLCHSSGATGPPVFTTLSNLDQRPPFRSAVTQIQESQGVHPMPTSVTTMERWGMSVQGHLTGFDPIASGGSGNRCVAHRVGGSVAAQ